MSEQDYRLETITGMYETFNKLMTDMHKMYVMNQELRDENESLKQLAKFYEDKARELRSELIVQRAMFESRG